jgi:RNA polymerase sigma-70 factor, ECF subfamily
MPRKSTTSARSEPSSATSPTLLREVQQGTDAAWSRLVECYRPLIMGCCRRRGLDASTSDDILQETLLSVRRSLPQFQSPPGVGAFRAWLRQIVERRITDSMRRSAREPVGLGGSSVLHRWNLVAGRSDSESGDQMIDIPSLSEAMVRLASSYSPRVWNAFERSVFDDRPTAEVAHEFQMTEVAVRQLRSRILRRLREILRPNPSIPSSDHGVH